MATPKRRPTPHLIDQLTQTPFYYEFHQVMKALESTKPEGSPLGSGAFPADEAIRIQSRVSLSPSPSDISHISYTQGTYVVEINFMGLAGLQGPLPLPYTERILDRQRIRDYGPTEFLDLFNHRFVSLFHCIYKKTLVGLYNKPASKMPIGRTIQGISGFLTQKITQDIPPETYLQFGAAFWHQQKNKFAFQKMLDSFFKVPISVFPFQGRWVFLDEAQKTKIGNQGQFQSLGKGACLGNKAWNQSAGIKMKVGPLPHDRFLTFLKSGQAYKNLISFCYAYLGGGQEFIVQLGIHPQEIPPLRLNGKRALGWTSWFSSQTKQDPDFQVHLYPTS